MKTNLGFDMKPFDMKKPLSLEATPHLDGGGAGGGGAAANGHAFSHYSQMGFKSHMMGTGMMGPASTVGVAQNGRGVAGSNPMTDWYGKLMSFSNTCQSPVLPSYYPTYNSTEKIDSHLWFVHSGLKYEEFVLNYVEFLPPANQPAKQLSILHIFSEFFE